MAALQVGTEAHDLTLVLTSGQDLIDTIQLQAGCDDPDGLPEGTPIDWPQGTTAYFTVRNRASTTLQTWPLVVDGPNLRVDVDSELVDNVTRQAKARLWIAYATGRPFVFALGEVVWDG